MLIIFGISRYCSAEVHESDGDKRKNAHNATGYVSTL